MPSTPDAVEAFINAGENEKSGLEMFKENFKDYSESNAEILSNISGEEINDASDYKKVFNAQSERLEENAKNIIEQQKESISGVAVRLIGNLQVLMDKLLVNLYKA